MREIKPSTRNIEQLASFREKLKDAQGIYLTDYTGLTVSEITDLRKRLRDAKIEYLVIKNTLSRIAFKEEGLEDLVPYLDGPNAIAIGYDEAVKPAKVISEFAKELKKPTITSCVVDGELFVGKDAEATKDFPSQDEVRSMIVGAISAPMSSVVGIFSNVMVNFLGVLEAYIQKRQAEES
jgi:large subunit ribosomal protein L10